MIDVAARHSKAVHDAHVLLRKYQLENPDISHQHLNYRIESERNPQLMEKRKKLKILRRKYSRILGRLPSLSSKNISLQQVEEKFGKEKN